MREGNKTERGVAIPYANSINDYLTLEHAIAATGSAELCLTDHHVGGKQDSPDRIRRGAPSIAPNEGVLGFLYQDIVAPNATDVFISSQELMCVPIISLACELCSLPCERGRKLQTSGILTTDPIAAPGSGSKPFSELVGGILPKVWGIAGRHNRSV